MRSTRITSRATHRGFGLLLLFAIACSSKHTDPPAAAVVSLDAPGDPLAPPAPGSVAQNIKLDEVALFQSIKISLGKDGQAADRSPAALPILGGRDAIVRVYVTPGDGWSPHDITARLKITTHTPTGTYARVFSATKSIDGASTDGAIDSTINIAVPGSAILAGSTFAVVLNEDKGAKAQDADAARFPQDGSFADMGVTAGGTRLRLVIVPIQYDADGSGRLGDTSDDQLKKYSDRFYQLYPAAKIELTVHDPLPYGLAINPTSSAGLSGIIMALGALHASDNADPDVYYYGAVEPAASFSAFCRGGCITGLSPVGSPWSAGVGFPDPETAETAVHEVGHAHGLRHAPCGGAAGPDPSFPYRDGSTGVWGLDPIDGKTLYPPSADKDLMGYCPPTWISDYHYAKIFARLAQDNQLMGDWKAGRASTTKYRPMHVSATGEATWHSWTQRGWPERGAPHVATFESASGETVAQDRAFYFPFDHADGGVLMVPELPSTRAFAKVRVANLVTALAPPTLP